MALYIVSTVNLLPWREEIRQEQKKEFITTLVAVALVGVVVTLGVIFYYGTLIDAQQQRINYVQEEIAKLDVLITELETLEERKARLLARIQAIEELQGKRTLPVRVLDALADAVPENATLESFKQSDNSFDVQGFAESNASISAMMRNIDGSEFLTNAELREITKSTTNVSGDEVEISKFELGFVLMQDTEEDADDGIDEL